jgi:hypothetical protein
MQFGSIVINRMGANNPSLWLWWDVRVGRFWYVLSWRKGRRPYCYRSLDATPPSRRPKEVLDGSDNQGRWYFGRREGMGD